MNKTVKYILWSVAILLLLYFSFDIRNLDEYKSSVKADYFDAEAYINNIWENKMPVIARQAPEISVVLDLLENNPDKAFSEYGNKLGISKTWYFMVKGQGVLGEEDAEAVWINLADNRRIRLATAFIFGNAVREGSGVVNINNFVNMTDFNNVSIALNKKVKTEVIPVLKNNLIAGQQISFAGAFEFSEDTGSLSDIRIIPVSVTTKDAE